MKLGTIHGEPILCISVRGEEQGDMCEYFYSYKEAYEFIKELKKSDRKEGIKDTYTITLETEYGFYEDYTIRKYRNRYIVK